MQKGEIKMPGKRVILMVKVTAVWSTLNEFNEYWGKESLPTWIEHGAKHIGSFVNWLGAPKSQIIRLFEFESLSAWEKFMQKREKMFVSEKGRELVPNLIGFIESLEESVWVSVY
jgi:glutaredoxin 2